MIPTADDFQQELDRIFAEGHASGKTEIVVRSGELHKRVGGYAGTAGNHRMPTCCQVMRRNMRDQDEIVSAPDQGQGATLLIRYQLPR